MAIVCDGCNAKFPSTPEGRRAAEAHLKSRHPNPFVGAIIGFVSLASLVAIVSFLVDWALHH